MRIIALIDDPGSSSASSDTDPHWADDETLPLTYHRGSDIA